MMSAAQKLDRLVGVPLRRAGMGALAVVLCTSGVAEAIGPPGAGAVAADVRGGRYLGRLSANRYAADSVSNRYGRFGSRYSPDSINNRYGRYGSPYSPYSAKNPYATRAPRLYSADGRYLGKVSANRYDPESISNPYGKYGSRYSPWSVNNPYGRYGSRYSPESATNPYATRAPIIIGEEPSRGTVALPSGRRGVSRPAPSRPLLWNSRPNHWSQRGSLLEHLRSRDR